MKRLVLAAALVLIPAESGRTVAVREVQYVCSDEWCVVKRELLETIAKDAELANSYAVMCTWVKP